MTVTDILVLLGFFLLIMKAVRFGLVYTLFWPIATLASGLFSACFYFIFNNLFCTLGVCAVNSFVINRLKPIFHKKPDDDDPITLSLYNRFVAVAVNLVWGTFLAFIIVLPLSLVPFDQYGLTDISRDILASRTCHTISEFVALPPNPSEAAVCPVCNSELTPLVNSPLVLELIKDPRIVAMMNDPDFIDSVGKKDFVKIANHPILVELRHDPAFLIKILRIQMTLRANTKY